MTTRTVNLLTEEGQRRLLGPEGTDAAMGEDEASRWAGPPPGPREAEELAALAAELDPLPAMVLCPEGCRVPAGLTCAACPVFTSCPGGRS